LLRSIGADVRQIELWKKQFARLRIWTSRKQKNVVLNGEPAKKDNDRWNVVYVMVRSENGLLDFALRWVTIAVPSESSGNVVFAG